MVLALGIVALRVRVDREGSPSSPFVRLGQPGAPGLLRAGISYFGHPWRLLQFDADPTWPPYAELQTRDARARIFAGNLVRYAEMDRIPERGALWRPKLIPVAELDDPIIARIIDDELGDKDPNQAPPEPEVMGELGSDCP
ncbi:MAG: hypothetical protein HC927_09020 [Deltaproteobacteria bacterium]|nr:hypothetical protein [Deltaproteobacteria bacterium]